MRGLTYKEGNVDGTTMNAIVFNGLGGKDLMNAPIPRGLPYGRHENTFYIKTSIVNSANSTKGRFPFGLQLNTVDDADAFEKWYTNITKTKNCFRCNAPSTLPLLHAANAQVDAATRSPPSAKLVAKAKKSPLLKAEAMSSAPAEALLVAFNAVDPESLDNIQPQEKSGGNVRILDKETGVVPSSEMHPSPLTLPSNEISPKSNGSSSDDDEGRYNSYDGTPVATQQLYWNEE